MYKDDNPFHDETDDSGYSTDNWDEILASIDFNNIPDINEFELPPLICNTGKSSKKKKGKAVWKPKQAPPEEGSASETKITSEPKKKKQGK